MVVVVVVLKENIFPIFNFGCEFSLKNYLEEDRTERKDIQSTKTHSQAHTQSQQITSPVNILHTD